MNKKEISVLAALVITFALSLCTDSIHTAENIKANTLRLHIMANSDGKYDQQIKMDVRQQILDMENLLPSSDMNYAIAMDTVEKNLPQIEKQINGFLAQKGINYSARCSLENFYFDTTQYNDFALPQGEYTALTVRLGEAEGKNWWCVVYPQLCSTVCGTAALENSDDFIKTQKPTARFKVVELYENIKSYFAERPQQYTQIE